MHGWTRERLLLAAALITSGAACNLDLEVIPGGGGGGSSADGGGGEAPASGGGGSSSTCDVSACGSEGPAGECMKWACIEDRCSEVPDDDQTVPCYTGPDGTLGVGVCEAGVAACVDGRPGACEGDLLPTPERCEDTLDNDCSGDGGECAGDVEWARFLKGVSRPQVVRTATEIIVAGRYYAGPSGTPLELGGGCAALPSPPGSFFIARFDPEDGACVSLDVLGASTGNVNVESLVRFDSGRLALTVSFADPVSLLGQAFTTTGGFDGVILGIDPGTTLAWRALLTGVGTDYFRQSGVDSEGLVTSGTLTENDATITDADGTTTVLTGSDGTTDALLAAFDEDGQLRYARRIQAVGGMNTESVTNVVSGSLARIVGSTQGMLNLGGEFSFSAIETGSFSAELDVFGIPTARSTIFEGPSSENMINAANGPGGVVATTGFLSEQLTSINCGIINDLGRTQGFVAEVLGGACASRTYATSSADNFVRLRFAGYDAAGALFVAGEHTGTLGGLTPSATFGAFLEKLPSGVGGPAAWRFWYDPGFTITGIVGLEMLPDSTSALLLSFCSNIDNPTFDEKLPNGEVGCLQSSGTYLAMFGP